MRTSIPPSSPRRSVTSSMKLRMEDAPAARLEQVLRSQRIGDFFGIEALALIEDPNDELARLSGRRKCELDGDELLRVLAIPVLHRIDHRLTRTATPIQWTASSSSPPRWAIRSLTNWTKSSISKLLCSWSLTGRRVSACGGGGTGAENSGRGLTMGAGRA